MQGQSNLLHADSSWITRKQEVSIYESINLRQRRSQQAIRKYWPELLLSLSPVCQHDCAKS
jgi:hypothetical protein